MFSESTTLSMNFNPRSRVGNDVNAVKEMSIDDIFQSTFPRGERQMLPPFIILTRTFQSTFPRGERLEPFGSFELDGDFNPRSRVGNDFCVSVTDGQIWDFNPRSRVGNDAGELLLRRKR